jgi:hypothetical protein
VATKKYNSGGGTGWPPCFVLTFESTAFLEEHGIFLKRARSEAPQSCSPFKCLERLSSAKSGQLGCGVISPCSIHWSTNRLALMGFALVRWFSLIKRIPTVVWIPNCMLKYLTGTPMGCCHVVCL